MKNSCDHEEVFSLQQIGVIIRENFLEGISPVESIGAFLKVEKSLTKDDVQHESNQLSVEYPNLNDSILIQVVKHILEIMPNLFLLFLIHIIIAQRMALVHETFAILTVISFALVNVQINVVLNVQQTKLVDEDVCCLDKSANELVRLVFYKFKVFEHISLYNCVNAEQVAEIHYIDVIKV